MKTTFAKRIAGNRNGATARRACIHFAHPIDSLERRTLLSAGDLDPSFGIGGIAGVNVPGTESEYVTVVDVANGRTFLGGVIPGRTPNGAPQSRVALAVLDAAGNRVTSFSGDGIETELLSVSGGVLDLAVQADNKIVVLAGENYYESDPRRVLARFNTNGSLDSSFGGGDGQVVLDAGESLALAPGGKIVVAAPRSNGRIGVARFTSSGAADGQVAANVGTTNTADLGNVFDVVVQPDGRVIVAGEVYEPLGTDGVIVRFSSSLAGLDSSFGGGDGIVVFDSGFPYDNYDRVSALALDAQGRIVAGVSIGAGMASVERLTPSGDPDSFAESDFAYRIGGSVKDVSVAPDGRIVASGQTFYDGDALIRFNANGGRDTSFGGGDGTLFDNRENENVGGPFSDVQPDGRIITAGIGFAAFRHVSSNSTPVGGAALGGDGVLRVTGTDAGNDDVWISDEGSQFPNDPVDVYVNGRWYSFPRTQAQRIEVSTLGGNDRVRDIEPSGTGGFLARHINGGSGDDELRGGGGKDTLLGQAGNDRLFGGNGDDLLDGGTGTDLMDGGAGADTVDYHFRNSAVIVDLQGDADDGPAGERDTVGANIEHIIGGNGSDTLTGNSLPNYIRGGPGNDTIRGGSGNDTLQGDAGQDRLYGDAGNDFLDAKDGITDLVLDGGIGFDKAKKDGSDPLAGIEQVVA